MSETTLRATGSMVMGLTFGAAAIMVGGFPGVCLGLISMGNLFCFGVIMGMVITERIMRK